MMWHSPHVLPSHSQVIALQQRAMRFWAWLHRSYQPATIATYWSAVLAHHRDSLQGTALAALGITFPAIKDHVDVFRIQNPTPAAKDNVWTLQHCLDILETSPSLQTWVQPAQSDEEFLRRSTHAVMNTLWSQLLRASEVLPSTGAPARAAHHLWNLSDVTFHASDGAEIPILDSGVPDQSCANQLAFANLRMVPSKADRHATNPPLRFPMPSAPTERALSPCAYFWDLFSLHPLPKIHHNSMPLFASSISSRSSRLSERQFMKQWKTFCAAAGMTFKFGKHAFRRGGINRLIDIGCSAPVIAALGRWKSDVWQIYARRNKEQLITVTAAMTVPNLNPPAFLQPPSADVVSLQNPSSAQPSMTRSSALGRRTSSSLALQAPSGAHQPTWTQSDSNAAADALSRSSSVTSTLLRGEEISSQISSLRSLSNEISVSQMRSQVTTRTVPQMRSQVTSRTVGLATPLQVPPAKALLDLPSHVVLQNSSKTSSAAHINARCEKAHGLSIRQAIQLRVDNKDRIQSKYSITDIRYDLLRGFLTLTPQTVFPLPQHAQLSQPAHPPKRCRFK